MITFRTRPLGRALTLALAALFIALAPAAPASAHAVLLATDPADRAALDSAPDAVTLSFNEPVRPVDEAMLLVDGNGEEQAVSAAAGNTDVIIDLPELADGSYHLNWRVVSADSHPISGVLSFTVGTGVAPPPVDAAETPTDRPWAVQVVNIAHYLGLLLFAGYALFRTAIARELAPPRPRHRLLRLAGALTILAAAAAVPIGALELAGQPLSRIADLDAWRGTVQNGALAALAVTVVGVAAVWLGAGRKRRPRSAPAVLIGIAAALSAPILTGHSMAFEPRWLMIAADAVHLATAAIWIGGIAGLTVVLMRLRRGATDTESAAAVVARFSGWAGYSVAALGASGIAMAWAIHREWASVFESDNGRALLVKLGLVAVALALAGWNRYRLIPSIRAVGEARAALLRLRRIVHGEAAVLAAVVALTGILVNLPPGAEPDTQEPAAADSGPVSLQASLGDGEARVQLDSGAPGEHSITLTLVDAAGAALEPLEAPAVTATLPERDFGPVEAVIHEYGPGQYHCIVDLPLPGDWELTVQVRASEFQSHSAVFDLPIG